MKHKTILTTFVLLGAVVQIYAQKRPLGLEDCGKWDYPKGTAISNDSRWISYVLGNEIIIEASDGSKRLAEDCGIFPDPARFTEDSHFAVSAASGNHCLYLLNLKNWQTSQIAGASHFDMPKGGGTWLSYSKDSAPENLVLRNLLDGSEKTFAGAVSSLFDPRGETLVIQTQSGSEGAKRYSISWLDMATGGSSGILSGLPQPCQDMTFSRDGQDLAFLQEGQVMLYRQGVAGLKTLATPSTQGGNGLTPQGPLEFSPDGLRVLFFLNQKAVTQKPTGASVDVWNYKDDYPQEAQLQNLLYAGDQAFQAVVGTQGGRIIRLVRNGEAQNAIRLDEARKYALGFTLFNQFERWGKTRPKYFVISMKTGKRTPVVEDNRINGAEISPGGKYVLYYSGEKRSYIAYEISTGISREISKGVPPPIDPSFDRTSNWSAFECAGWVRGDAALLVYDTRDVWQLDPRGLKPPIDLTKGYGRRNGIILTYIHPRQYDVFTSGPDLDPFIEPNRKLILCGFELATKSTAFYYGRLGETADPIRLSRGGRYYFMPRDLQSPFYPVDSTPITRDPSKLWILRGQTEKDAPNLFATRDFRTFTELTNYQPQSKVNWLTTELVSWRGFDGKQTSGILYKPENFNPKKRYPVILFYYRQASGDLHVFVYPDLSVGPINIPYLVSNGYLVFTPDINFEAKHFGRSIYDSVASAAKFLAKMPWVDPTKMATTGFSQGGSETNLLLTRTGMFAAAVEGAGESDMMPSYTDTLSGGFEMSYIEQAEHMESTPWNNRTGYIDNSPVYFANRVKTPLLILHNKGDTAVNWLQGQEWFMALRRLGKKVWMLQYDHQGHALFDPKDELDYTVRMKQFLDYYLKGALPPVWMTRGVRASLKGVKTGLELDTSGAKP